MFHERYYLTLTQDSTTLDKRAPNHHGGTLPYPDDVPRYNRQKSLGIALDETVQQAMQGAIRDPDVRTGLWGLAQPKSQARALLHGGGDNPGKALGQLLDGGPAECGARFSFDALLAARRFAADRNVRRRLDRAYRRFRKIGGQLVSENTGLVHQFARKSEYAHAHFDYEDRFQEGILGLIRAVEKWDVHREIRFSTYACTWIRQAISYAYRSKVRLVRVPSGLYSDYRQYRQAFRALFQDLGRMPTVTETARACGFSPQRVCRLVTTFEEETAIGSSNEEDDELEPGVEDIAAYTSPEDVVDSAQRSACLQSWLRQLPARERSILRRRFGLSRGGRTYMALAKELGVSPETVRQTELRGIARLRGAAGTSTHK